MPFEGAGALGNSFVDWATLNCRKECIELLLKFGADANVENFDKQNALDVAMKFDLIPIIVSIPC